MREVCSVEVLFPAKGTAFAVIPAAGAWQRVTTGGAVAGSELAVSLAFLTQALLAGVSWMRKALPIYKHLCLQDAVWALGAALAWSILGLGTGQGRTVDHRTPHSPILTVAGLTRAVHICEVLPIRIH